MHTADKASEYGQICTDRENRPKSQEFIPTAAVETNMRNCNRGSSDGCGQLPRDSFGGQQSQDSDAGCNGSIALAVIGCDEPENVHRRSRRCDADRDSGEAGRMATYSEDEFSMSTTTKLIVDPLTPGVAEINKPQRRTKSPFSPGAMRARGLIGLRSLLALGSEAQVVPACSPPSLTTDSKRLDTMAKSRSPVPWSSGKLGRGKGLGGGVTLDMHDDQIGGAGVLKPDAGKEGTFQGNTLAEAAGETRALPRQESIEGTRNIAEKTKAVTEVNLVGNGGRELHATTAIHRKSFPGNTKCMRDTALDATLTAELVDNAREVHSRPATSDSSDSNHGAWPSPLDDEVDPDKWALGEGERDVLAAATRSGSVLVRVVTWNLHAKPAPGAEELKKTLLPPGKVRAGRY